MAIDDARGALYTLFALMTAAVLAVLLAVHTLESIAANRVVPHVPTDAEKWIPTPIVPPMFSCVPSTNWTVPPGTLDCFKR